MRIFTVTVCVAVVATCAASADIVLTFDDLGLPDGTEVTDHYAGLGVIFSVPAGGTTRVSTASFPIFPGDPQGLYNDEDVSGIGIAFTEPIIADFSIDAVSAGAFIDFGGVGDGLKIEAFDGPGGTGNLLGTATTVNETFLGVNAAGIRSVVFSQAGGLRATYLIDHFTFELVPNPGVLAVFCVGALLTNGRRRR